MRKDVSGWQVRLDEALIERYTASGDWPGKTLAEFAEDLARRHFRTTSNATPISKRSSTKRGGSL